MSAPTESAVLVPVPEAEPVVGRPRARWDRAAGWGVPAHVTVLHPFVPPAHLGPAELQRLRDAVRSVPRFAVAFTEVRWFDDRVVWLAPDPPDGFRALTDAVRSAFPEHPPYGGEFDDVVPHLTVGVDAGRAALSAAAAAVREDLPVRATVRTAHLFQGSPVPRGWRAVARLPLGSDPAARPIDNR